jgi:hypothetical protein
MQVLLKVMGLLGLIGCAAGLVFGTDRGVWFTAGTACVILIGVGFILGELKEQTQILKGQRIQESIEPPEE